MRKIITLAVFQLLFGTLSAQTTLDKVSSIYERNVEPYFKKIARDEAMIDRNEVIGSDVGTHELIRSRELMLAATADLISIEVRGKIKDNPKAQNDKAYLMNLMDHYYRTQFVGLDPLFYKETHAEIMRLE